MIGSVTLFLSLLWLMVSQRQVPQVTHSVHRNFSSKNDSENIQGWTAWMRGWADGNSDLGKANTTDFNHISGAGDEKFVPQD